MALSMSPKIGPFRERQQRGGAMTNLKPVTATP